MATGYAGEIRMFAFSYSTGNYVPCIGQTLTITGYETLFAAIGNTFGGNGITDFKLPDLRGRVPVHRGSIPNVGKINWYVGMYYGTETMTLTVNNLPSHTHDLRASKNDATKGYPEKAVLARPLDDALPLYNNIDSVTAVKMSSNAVSNEGGYEGKTSPHTNVMPSLAINFSIAVQGLFPERNRG